MFQNSSGFTSCENNESIIDDCSIFDMEIFNVHVFLEDELPIGIRGAQALVSRTLNFKFVIFEVNISINRDGLSLSPYNINVLCNGVEAWQFSCFAPLITFEIE